MAEILTDENFDEKTAGDVSLVDFYADWCGPCKMISPIVEEVSNEREDANIYKLDVDAAPQIAAKFGIRSIPTLIVFKNGEVVNKHVGSANKADINKLIDSAL